MGSPENFYYAVDKTDFETAPKELMVLIKNMLVWMIKQLLSFLHSIILSLEWVGR